MPSSVHNGTKFCINSTVHLPTAVLNHTCHVPLPLAENNNNNTVFTQMQDDSNKRQPPK